MTNYEKIKAMSVEEMAKVLSGLECVVCPASEECEKEEVGKTCDELLKEYLLQEAEE